MERNNFLGRDFLTLMDYTREEIEFVLDIAKDFKKKVLQSEPHEYLKGRTIAALFEKASTRTRLSFQVACSHLGADSYYLKSDEMQLNRGEPIKDTARVIDRYCDGLFIRTFGQEIVNEYAAFMNKPVINALTDLTHPCQGLADLLTIREKKGIIQGLKLAYVGDIWNVCHTIMVFGALFGMDVNVVAPPGYNPDYRISQFTEAASKNSGASIRVTESLEEAVREADIVYANTWHSMGGPEKTKEQRILDFASYQINASVLGLAKKDVIFMHCLPGYRGEEMTDDVIEGKHSVVFDQAENRMHTEKAILFLVVK